MISLRESMLNLRDNLALHVSKMEACMEEVDNECIKTGKVKRYRKLTSTLRSQTKQSLDMIEKLTSQIN